MILDNPFHVLGLPADCTTKELNRRKSQAEAYLRIGKPLEFDEDLYISRHCHRNSSTLGRAIKQLHDGRERMQHGLFWFTRGGPLDAHALRLLARGRTRDAYEALARIGSRPVDAATAPSLNNFGTLCLLLGLDPPSGETGAGGSELRSDRIMYGLRAKARLVGQLPEPDLVRFCSSLGDELAARDAGAVVEAFGESLKRAIEEAKRYGVSVSGRKQVEALHAGGARLAPIKAELGSAAREKIERAIKACEASRRRDPSAANDAARELQRRLQVHIPALADATSTDDYLYRSLADAGAEALVSTTTVYFNHRAEHGGVSLEVILELLPIGEYAAEIASGGVARQRARDDVATLRRIEADERQRSRFGPAFAAMGEWFAECDGLGKNEDAAPSRLEAFVRASLDPAGRPGQSIVAPLKTLNVAESPLCDSSADEDSEAIAMNSSVCNRLLTLAVRAHSASGGRFGGELILTRLSDAFVGVAEARAGRANRFPVDSACVERLRENLGILIHNRAVQEAAAPKQGCMGAFAALLLMLLASVLLIAEIAGADPQRTTGGASPDVMQEEREEGERRLEELEAAIAAMSDRVETLEVGRERDAASIRRLEAALGEAERARSALAARTGARGRAQELRTDTIRRELSAVRSGAAQNTNRLAAETLERVAGDRRGAWYAGGALAFVALGVGLLWRWSRRRTDGLGKRFDQSWSGLQEFLAEAGEQSGKTLAALEALVSREAPSAADAEPDHKLVLLMCNEINRMENNLRHMDTTARGHKKLLGVVRRMKENLGARGYQITELHGQRYDTGLTVLADDLITDDSLDPGRKVISWVKTPEVRYRDRIVQAANVQVATGP